jgi:hypothetical protein
VVVSAVPFAREAPARHSRRCGQGWADAWRWRKSKITHAPRGFHEVHAANFGNREAVRLTLFDGWATDLLTRSDETGRRQVVTSDQGRHLDGAGHVVTRQMCDRGGW